MQDSEKKRRDGAGGKNKSRAIALILFIVLFIGTNVLLCFLMEPYKSSSQEMWEGYEAAASDPPDTIITGTSQGLSGINPTFLDSTLASSSYNMSTNMQSLASTLKILQTASSDYPLKRIILVIDHEILDLERTDNKRAEEALWHARAETVGGARGVKEATAFVTDKDFVGTSASLTFFTPWVYNRSTDISLNVREKLAGRVLDTKGHRLENGYEPDESVVDQSIHFVTLDEAAAWDEENKDTVDFQDLSMTEDNASLLREICTLCRKRGITLYPVAVPYPNFLNIYRLSDYAALHDALETLFGKYGYTYCDFNLIKRDVLSMDSSMFKDVGHMNMKGAEKFSSFLGSFIKKEEEGEDLTAAFEDPWAYVEKEEP